MIHFYTGIVIVVIFGYFMLKYLDGDFTVVDEAIIEQGNLLEKGVRVGKYYIIKKTYQNGKIKIFRKEV